MQHRRHLRGPQRWQLKCGCAIYFEYTGTPPLHRLCKTAILKIHTLLRHSAVQHLRPTAACVKMASQTISEKNNNGSDIMCKIQDFPLYDARGEGDGEERGARGGGGSQPISVNPQIQSRY